MQPNNNNKAEPEIKDNSGGLDMSRIFSKVLNILPWVIISVLLALVLAKVYLRYAVSVYSVKTQILIKDERLSGGDKGIIEDLGISTSSNKIIDNEMDILASYELNREVVDSLHLDVEIQEEGRIKKTFVYGKTAPFFVQYCKREEENATAIIDFVSKVNGIEEINLDGTRKFYPYKDTMVISNSKMVLHSNPDYVFNPANKQKMYLRNTDGTVSRFKSLLNLSLSREFGGVLVISIQDQIPERGIDILNKLIERYLAAGLDDKNVVSRNGW